MGRITVRLNRCLARVSSGNRAASGPLFHYNAYPQDGMFSDLAVSIARLLSKLSWCAQQYCDQISLYIQKVNAKLVNDFWLFYSIGFYIVPSVMRRLRGG